jgi:hypothetical protein
MRWMIGGQGWPIAGGLRLLPPGTLVGDGGIPLAELPTPMPIDAISLDADALAQMKQWYGSELHHRLLVGPDVGKAPQTTSAPPTKVKHEGEPMPKMKPRPPRPIRRRPKPASKTKAAAKRKAYSTSDN